MSKPFGIKNQMGGKLYLCDSGANFATKGLGLNFIEIPNISGFKVTMPEACVDLDDSGALIFAEPVDVMDRGRFEERLLGEQKPITFSAQSVLRSFTDLLTLAQCVLDVAHWNPNRSPASAVDTTWTPMNGVVVTSPEWQLVWKKNGVTHGESKDHYYWLGRVYLAVKDISEAMPTDTYTIEGKAWTLQRA